jgi:hypothetical protein
VSALALLLALGVAPAVPAASLKCAKCADPGQVVGPVVSAAYDACFVGGVPRGAKPATVALEVRKDGTVSALRWLSRGSLDAAQGKCVLKVLRTLTLPPAKLALHVELALVFAPSLVPLQPEGFCSAPSAWNVLTRRCVLAPCAGCGG